MHTQKKTERGQVLILIALALVGVIGITALAIDLSITYDARRSAQNAADSAALAGALAYINGQNATAAAYNAAVVSGFDNDGVQNWVEVHHPPLSGEYAGNNEYIQVIIRNQTDPSFLQAVFSGDVTSEVEAIARAKPADKRPLYGEYAIVTLKPNGKDVFSIGGNPTLEIIGGGIFDNSDNSKAFTGSGNIKLYVAEGVYVVGDEELKGNVHLTHPTKHYTTQFYTDVPHITYEDPQVPPPVKPSAPSCSGIGSKVGSTYSPGNFEEIKISGNGSYTFNSGNYCITKKAFSASGNLTINGSNLAFYIADDNFDLNGNITFTGSNILIYVNKDSFSVNGNIEFSGDNLTVFAEDDFRFNGNTDLELTGDNSVFYINSGSISLNGNTDAAFDATSTLFYLKQGSFDVNGNQNISAAGVTFYLENGNFKWNGNSDINLSAPTEGPYKGLLVYLPEGNSSGITLNGNSDVNIVGTILAPSSEVKLTGNSDLTSYHSQIICYTMNVQGNFEGMIDFKDDENWQVVGDPFIELPH